MFSRDRRFQKLPGTGTGTAVPVPVPVLENEKKPVPVLGNENKNGSGSIPKIFRGTGAVTLGFKNVIHESLFLMSLIMFCLVSKRPSILITFDNVHCIIEKNHKPNSTYIILTKNYYFTLFSK